MYGTCGSTVWTYRKNGRSRRARVEPLEHVGGDEARLRPAALAEVVAKRVEALIEAEAIRDEAVRDERARVKAAVAEALGEELDRRRHDRLLGRRLVLPREEPGEERRDRRLGPVLLRVAVVEHRGAARDEAREAGRAHARGLRVDAELVRAERVDEPDDHVVRTIGVRVGRARRPRCVEERRDARPLDDHGSIARDEVDADDRAGRSAERSVDRRAVAGRTHRSERLARRTVADRDHVEACSLGAPSRGANARSVFDLERPTERRARGKRHARGLLSYGRDGRRRGPARAVRGAPDAQPREREARAPDAGARARRRDPEREEPLARCERVYGEIGRDRRERVGRHGDVRDRLVVEIERRPPVAERARPELDPIRTGTHARQEQLTRLRAEQERAGTADVGDRPRPRPPTAERVLRATGRAEIHDERVALSHLGALEVRGEIEHDPLDAGVGVGGGGRAIGRGRRLGTDVPGRVVARAACEDDGERERARASSREDDAGETPPHASS